MTDYRTYILSKRDNIWFITAYAITSAIISELFFDSIILSFVFFFFYKTIKSRVCNFLKEKRLRELNIQFKDCLYSLAASFSSGRHMRDAVEAAQISLSELYGSESNMVRELQYMLNRIDLTSDDEILVWREFASRCDSEDINSFIEVYEACRDTGGNIVRAINRAAVIITQKISIEHEMKTQMIQRQYEGQIIGLMPFLMLLFLRLASADYISVMYECLAGRMIMALSLCLIILSLMIEEKISSVEI